MDSELEILLMKKEILELKYGANSDRLSLRYNENHDPDNGQFTSVQGGKAGKRSSKRCKSLRVPEQEYAIIAEPISRNYDMRFKKYAGKGTCHAQSANYDYRVEITDRHSFIILGRRKLQ